MPTPSKRRAEVGMRQGEKKKKKTANSETGSAGMSSEKPKAVKLAAADADTVEEEAEWMNDDEAPFPRGGGSALTPLEHRQVAQQAKEDALFGEGEGSGSDDDVAGSAGFRARLGGGDAPVVAARLRASDLVVGMQTLVAVKEVHSTRAMVSMPSGLTGVLERHELSDELHEAIASGEVANPPDLRKLLAVGEIFSAAILGPPKSPAGTPRSGRGRGAFSPVPISLRLSLVQAAALSGGAQMPKGSLVWGVVQSIQEYGAILSLGGDARGFLHKKYWTDATRAPSRWRPVLNATLAPTQSGLPTQLGAPATSRKPLGVNTPLGFENLLAGLLVNATVTGVLGDGVRVSFCGGFEGSISTSNLGTLAKSTWARDVAVGSKLLARVLWLHPSSKTVSLSHAEHLTSVAPNVSPSVPRGERLEFRVDVVARDGAVGQCTRPSVAEDSDDKASSLEVMQGEDVTSEGRLRGWLAASDIADLLSGQRPTDGLRKLTSGSRLSVVVIGFDPLLGFLLLSARASVLKKASPPMEAPGVGDVVEATVIRLGPTGARLRLGGPVGGSLLGRASRFHLTDEKLKKPEATLRVGQAVRALVMKGSAGLTPSGCSSPAPAPILIMTIKPSLVNSTLPRITSFVDAKPGEYFHGTVEAVRSSSVLIAFLNDIKGIVFGSELRATLGAVWDADPASCYWVGQTVRVRVLKADAQKRQLILSFLSAEEAAAKPAFGGSSTGVAVPYPPGAAIALSPGDKVHGVVSGWQDATAKKELGGGEEGVWVALDEGGNGWLPLAQLGDMLALLPLWRVALKPGVRLPPLTVLMVQPKALGGAGRATLSAKTALSGVLTTRRCPSSAAEALASDGVRVLCGWVAKVKHEGVYVGFAGPLRGYAATAAISDASSDACALIAPGQSVLARVAEGSSPIDARTLVLNLRHDEVIRGAEAEALDGVGSAAAAVASVAASAGADGPGLAAICASFQAERWRIATARAMLAATATSDTTPTDEEAADAAADRASRLLDCVAAEGSEADLPTLRAMRAIRVGSVVELSKSSKSILAVSPSGVAIHTSVVGDAPKLKKHNTIRAVVLDADPLAATLHVSTSDELIAAAEAAPPTPAADKSHKKKKRAAESTSVAADGARRLRVGEKVTGQVVLSRAGFVVLSLPKYGHSLGIASHHALWSAAGANAETLVEEATVYTLGKRVKAIVTALPAEFGSGDVDEEHGVLVPPPPPMVLSIIGAAIAPAAGVPSEAKLGDHRTLAPLRRKSDARPGAHALARVVGISSTGLTIVLDKKGALRGRVHFTELVSPGQRVVLPSEPPAEHVHVVVLGGGAADKRQMAKEDRKSAKDLIECTMRPQNISGGGSSAISRLTADDLTPGQIVTGWVRDATEKAVWVCLSPHVAGRVSAAEASTNPIVVSDLSKHFAHGDPVTARVVSVKPPNEDETSKKPRITLSLLLNPEDSAANRAARRVGLEDERTPPPAEGSIVKVRVHSVYPGRGADVIIEGGARGRVHITEIVDAWEGAPLDRLTRGKHGKQTADATTGNIEVVGRAAEKEHKAVILHSTIDERGRSRIELSMRASSLAAYGDAPGEHARPMSVADLSVGQLVRGYIKQASARGAFVCLSRGLDGFVPLRLIADVYVQANEVAEMLPPGTFVLARVVQFAQGGADSLPSLSLRQSDVEGGAMKKRLTFEELQTGKVVSGVVRKVADFGVFVRLNGSGDRHGEALDALCHASEASDSRVTDLSSAYPVGSTVRAIILKTNAEKRQISISLRPSRLRELGENDDDNHELNAGDVRLEDQGSQSGESEHEMDTDEDDALDDGDEDEANESDGESSDVAVDSDEGEDALVGGIDQSDGESDFDDKTDYGKKPVGRKSVPSLVEALGGEDPLAKLRDDDDDDEEGPGLEAGGFDWSGFVGADRIASVRQEQEEDKEVDLGRRGRQAREKTSYREREALMREQEAHLTSGEARTADDFERLLLGEPANSRLWVDYMGLQLSLAELHRAREIGERALRTIPLTAEDERFNVWAALLNLEKQFGDAESLSTLFKRALSQANPLKIYLHVAAAHERAGDVELADSVYAAAIKRERRERRVWLAWLEATFHRGEHTAAKALLQRAVDALPQAEHVELISKYGQLEFKHGSIDRGRTVFDGVLASYPKRIDVWSVYLDMELRNGDASSIKRLFERVISLKMSSKKAKFFFKRYLQYASDIGDAVLAAHVKEKARAWVEAATAA